MTFVFATLDNAVTLVHAAGSVDIGQWPESFWHTAVLLPDFYIVRMIIG